MKTLQKSWTKSLIVGLLFISAASLGLWYYYQPQRQTVSILDFNEQRDTQFILDIFKRDWWWLVSEYSTDFSPEYMLAHRASSQKPEHVGNLTIKVGYDQDKPTGFVAYYKKNFYHGYILFIDVVPEYRSKGVGYKLFDYAVQDLKKRGATKIGLVTRTTNEPAQKLYKRYGFKEVNQYNGFVNFEYTV